MKKDFDQKKIEGAKRYLLITFYSLGVAIVFAVVSRIGLPLTYYFFTSVSKWLVALFTLLALTLFVYSFGTVPYTFGGIGLPGPPMWIQYLLSLVGVLLFLWAFPALIIYWIINPQNVKRAIKIGVFLSSSGLAVIYYLSNRKVFRSPADTVSFFSGACFGPVAIVEILME
jgi:hypothetical protein